MAARDETELVNALWIRTLNNDPTFKFWTWEGAPKVRQVQRKKGGGGGDKRGRRSEGGGVVIGNLVSGAGVGGGRRAQSTTQREGVGTR
jgi:hypothetical protein